MLFVCPNSGRAARVAARHNINPRSPSCLRYRPTQPYQGQERVRFPFSLSNQWSRADIDFFQGYPVDTRMESNISVLAETTRLQPLCFKASAQRFFIFFCLCLASLTQLLVSLAVFFQILKISPKDDKQLRTVLALVDGDRTNLREGSVRSRPARWKASKSCQLLFPSLHASENSGV